MHHKLQNKLFIFLNMWCTFSHCNWSYLALSVFRSGRSNWWSIWRRMHCYRSRLCWFVTITHDSNIFYRNFYRWQPSPTRADVEIFGTNIFLYFFMNLHLLTCYPKWGGRSMINPRLQFHTAVGKRQSWMQWKWGRAATWLLAMSVTRIFGKV